MIESYFSKTANKKRERDNPEPCQTETSKRLKQLDTVDNLPSNREDHPSQTWKAKHPPSKELKWRKIRSENLDLDYTQLFNKKESDFLFQLAERVITYEKSSKVFVFGKFHNVPRKQVSYGDDGLSYTFSGVTVTPKQWRDAPFLEELRDVLSDITGYRFNFVLVNRYKDGNDHMGEHRDDEKELLRGSPIASLSLGQARDFVFRHKDTRGSGSTRNIDPVKIELENGSLLMMNHPTNVYWYHSLPVRKRLISPRINFTFRQMIK